MGDYQSSEEKLTDEFRNIGQNLIEILKTAWDQPERKRLQEEIENGLNELGKTIQQESDEFIESPTGQQLKSDIENISERLRSGETQQALRQELMTGLQTVNSELQKIIDRLSKMGQEEMEQEESSDQE